jgi:DNA-binding protein HU-beta
LLYDIERNNGVFLASNSFIETMTDTLKEGGTVVLPGFGTYAATDRAARTGRNPQIGEPIAIAEATLPK